MKVAVYSQYYQGKSLQAVHELLEVLSENDVDIYLEKTFYDASALHISKSLVLHTFDKLDNSFELLVSVGGDGTILRAVTFVRDYAIPIVGINTGRLGFLATIRTEGIKEAIKSRGNVFDGYPTDKAGWESVVKRFDQQGQQG